jgi:hypothetical protein
MQSAQATNVAAIPIRSAAPHISLITACAYIGKTLALGTLPGGSLFPSTSSFCLYKAIGIVLRHRLERC